MATASSTQLAAERVGGLVKATPEASLYTAKLLRTAVGTDGLRLDLWPAPGRGVRNAKFQSSHLINLLLALGCGAPVEAVDTVETFRGMLPENQTMESRLVRRDDAGFRLSETEVHSSPVLPGDTLGEALDWIIETLADPATSPEVRNDLRAARVFVTIEPSPSANIVIRFVGKDQPVWSTAYWPVNHQPTLIPPPRPTGELQRVFYGAAFEALATIWNGTKANTGPGTFPSGGQDKAPEKENAALPQAAPSPASPPDGTPNGTPHKQLRGVNNCEPTACVCVSSRGSGQTASAPNNRRHSRDRAHDNAAA